MKSPRQIKELIKSKGWRVVDVAAYWDLSYSHLSQIINSPNRSGLYEYAFLGLPPRRDVDLVLQARHVRVSKPKVKRLDVFAVGDTLIAEDSKFGEDGSVWEVVGVEERGGEVFVTIALDEEQGGKIELSFEAVAKHFAQLS